MTDGGITADLIGTPFLHQHGLSELPRRFVNRVCIHRPALCRQLMRLFRAIAAELALIHQIIA